ncbi:hypothetical protein HPP92_025187 [Vanilla planifolia]|uniref:Methyltransferase PMT27 n=1 Tax=Vanilla planifolia TaxID=51239 RepID=A0A835PJM1_VANPL|nr:hypothetical protein HPP92_025187 [Vanilla planifolia]
MPTLSKGSRGGKRGSSSSSTSWISTAAMLLLVSLLVFGVYVLTSSSTSLLSSTPKHHATSDLHSSRFVLKDPRSPSKESSLEDGPAFAREEGDSTAHSESAASNQESSEAEKNTWARDQETQNQGDAGGISSQAQIEHDSDGTIDEHQHQSQDSNSAEEEQQRQEQQLQGEDNLSHETEQNQPSVEQQANDHDDRGQQSDVQQLENEEHKQDEENGNDSQEEIQEHTNESRQQQQLQQQMEEERGNENQLRFNVGNDESHSSEDSLSNPTVNASFSDTNQLEEPRKGGDSDDRPWEAQVVQSRSDAESQISSGNAANLVGYEWELCNTTAGTDYIPCLDNMKAIKKLNSFKHYRHRERHCPENAPTCLVPLPEGYKRSIAWPKSRDKIWYNNVPRTKLAEVKGHQNWVKVEGDYLTFPGGGTQFIRGALHYIDFIQQSERNVEWGKHTRVILDVGCGVASFGGYLFERDVLTMSFAPKDEHEAQIQFALERGIPAISAVMGSKRLPFPGFVFDLVHCARCRVPWHADGGMLLLELNRVLRPGGYFVWSATPVYQKLKEDVEIWKAMSSLTKSMCWDLVTIEKDKLNGVAAAIYRKPTANECYNKRKNQSPPTCEEDDDPNVAWYVPLKTCMHPVPVKATERGTKWPVDWPQRLVVPPYWLNGSHISIHGKPAPDDFKADYEHWKHIVAKSYLNGLGINWSKIRNVMDMRAAYGGFAAALKQLQIWVMNVVNIDAPDTLPIIYERGLFGMYHDWCESFSTYPRTYDLLHADHLFSNLKERCSIVSVITEIDRIVRPGGKLIVRDDSAITSKVESLLKSLHWEVQLTFSKDNKGVIAAEKSSWRPKKYSASS